MATFSLICAENRMAEHLTQPGTTCGGDPSKTYAGQAHFAGGTPGKECRQCRYHGMTSGKRLSRVPYEAPKAMPCFKARQLGLKTPFHVPVNALACKYFEPKGD